MDSAKLKIKKIVTNYKSVFSDEYKLFLDAAKHRKSTLKNQYGEIKGDLMIERLLNEYPETLDTMIYSGLEPEELVWFRSKTGSRWFGKTYKEFNVSKV